MEDPLWTMRTTLVDALDQISSTRSSTEIRSNAFETMERHFAAALSHKDDKEGLSCFLALQYTFECNVPLRLLSWISLGTTQLDKITKGSMDESQEQEASTLASQLAQALSLIQGITLSHTSCKDYLGRKYALEVLLDLLMASRHLPSTISDSDPEACRKLSLNFLPLTSVVLDTLLCILVDSSHALRAFEDVNGPQAVVRILKRAGTPREVRMKCLEFLYFYLLDETTPTEDSDSEKSTPTPTVPTAPATPIRPQKRYIGIGATPRRPTPTPSAYGSSTYAFTESTSGKTSRSTSGSSTLSFSSTSSNASSSTAASSLSSSPEKPFTGRTSLRSRSPQKTSSHLPSHPSSSQFSSKTPPTSPPGPAAKGKGLRFPAPLQPRMMMLKKEVEYEPMSPNKPSDTHSVAVPARHIESMSILSSEGASESVRPRLRSAATVPEMGDSSLSFVLADQPKQFMTSGGENGGVKRRTAEEKKELLGTMLGNVDALVEGVRKAGIWGLG